MVIDESMISGRDSDGKRCQVADVSKTGRGGVADI